MYDDQPPAHPPPPYSPFDLGRVQRTGQPAPALAVPGVSPQVQGAQPVYRAAPSQAPQPVQRPNAPSLPQFAPPSGPPPGHAPVPATPAAAPPVAPSRASDRTAVRQGREDALELLREYDTIFIIDDSASMEVNEMPDGSIGPSRWEEARDALCGVVETASKYDDDGIDVHFINDSRSLVGCREPQEVFKLFANVTPNGATPTGSRLELLLLDYLDKIEIASEQNKKSPGSVKGPKRRNVREC
mgnify:CR=1 FL=1